MDREFARSALGASARRPLAIVLMALMVVTMTPLLGFQNAFAQTAEGGLLYEIKDGEATVVGFEDGAALEGALVVPETVGDGATVKAVEIAEGQVADKVTSLALPQAVDAIKTEGLAAALPALSAVEVAGNDGAYSSVAGMLFRSAEGQASSDGTAFAEDALELVWAPPAMVVARIPLECRAIASGAFVDAAALETVMSFGKMESIASVEKDDEGNVTKPGAFTDEQISRLTIVVPGTNYAVTNESAERVSGSVALSEKTDMLEKRKAWFHHGFDTSQIIMGAPFGEIEGVNAVSDDGAMEDRSLVTPLENGKSHLELTPEEEAEKAARRGEDPEAGLSFSYQASMDLSVRWAGDRSATPAHIDVPAYAKVDGVTYQVTQIEPNAFEGAVFLASVTIPEGVTSIGESAFAGCANLKSVQLPSTLKTIDYAAFKGTALESVDIPESVRWIGGEAFDGDVANQPAGDNEYSGDSSLDTYSSTATVGVLSSEDELPKKVITTPQTSRFYTTGIINKTKSTLTVQTRKSEGHTVDSLASWSTIATSGETSHGPNGTVESNAELIEPNWYNNNGVAAFVRDNVIYYVAFNGSIYYKYHVNVTSGLTHDLSECVTLNGHAVPTYPSYTYVGLSSDEKLRFTIKEKPKRFNIRYEANGGTWTSGSSPTGKQYVEGEGTPLEPSGSISREGYWFMGWTPPKTAAIDGDYTSENPEVVKSAGVDWYGNVVLTAVWKPKTYALTYDISKAADDSISIRPGKAKTFVHPSAIAGVRDLSTDEADLADFRENNKCIDISDIAAERGEYLDMQMATLSGEPAGYKFQGWSKTDYTAGVIPGDPSWTEGDGPWNTFTKDVVDALWADQDDASTNDPTANEATVYGVYKALGTATVTLGAASPAGAPTDDGKELGWVDAAGSPAAGAIAAQNIYYWPKKGLVNASAGQTSDTGYINAEGQNLSTGKAIDSTQAAGIDRNALKRYGYRFLGWGKGGVPYIAYDEDTRQCALTAEGEDVVQGWNASDSVADDAWDALWEVRTYEVALRLPAPAVKNADRADRDTAERDYKWWEVGTGDDSSWYVATKEWNYWDEFYAPGYELRSGFNTYEGWYRTKDKPEGEAAFITHAQGVKGSGEVFHVSPDKLPAGPDASSGTMAETDSGLEAPDGAVELWMCYTPIYIDVTAPIGVFLAENDAYVVGSDKRTDLETAAKFTVKGQTHDLVLTGVTATDIVQGTVGEGTTEDGITTYPVEDLAAVGDEGVTGEGLCSQMFDIYHKSGDDKRFGALGPRIFWVSPKSTVTPANATHNDMTGTKDTDARRYFGFSSGVNTLVDDQKSAGDNLDSFKLKKDATTSDAKGGLDVIASDETSKTYRFWYGLDLRKTDFQLGNLQRMVEESQGEWEYNTDHKNPLVKVMFTFAVEQVPMVAYSARFGETYEGTPAASAQDVTEEIVVG